MKNEGDTLDDQEFLDADCQEFGGGSTTLVLSSIKLLGAVASTGGNLACPVSHPAHEQSNGVTIARAIASEYVL
jgi:hypothetical protein